jgi:hypothetical protein
VTYSVHLEREDDASDGDPRRVLAEHELAPDGDGYVWVEKADGGSAEIHVADTSFVAFNYVALSPELVQLFFAIAQEGYRVFGDNATRALTTSPARVAAATDDDWAVVLCTSSEEMHEALSEPFEEWVEYRDQVVADADSSPIRRFFSRLRR